MSSKKTLGKPNLEENKDKHEEKPKEDQDSSELDKEKKDIENTKFQSLPLREYYDHAVTSVLLEGLRELGRQRPKNPIQFLGKFMLDHDPEK